MSIIIFFIALSILILVHELGHFFAAKKNGVGVEEFGIGFPPRILSIKYKGTLYSINAIPIGGFVKLYGEEYTELTKIDKKNYQLSEKNKQKAFSYKKPWQKFLIVIGGVVGNFLLGWILISFLFTQGVPSPAGYVIVEGVKKNSPAALSDIRTGDKIIVLKKNDKELKLTTASDLINLTKKYAGQSIILVIEREGKKMEKKLFIRRNPPKGEGPLGVVITSFIEKKYPWYQAPIYGLVEAFKITKIIISELIKVLFQLITLQKPNIDVAGPVGIASYTASVVKFGKNAILQLIALLSLNLAVVNILPFPALDGGRLIFVLYEWITRKRVNQMIEKYVNMFGIIILLSLAILITYFDIIKLINKQ